MYTVANRSFNNLEEAQTYCNQCDFDYDLIQTIEENTTTKIKESEPVESIQQPKEIKKAVRPATINTVKKLNYIIKTGKRDIKEYMDAGCDRHIIYNWIELIKKDCQKYSDSNKTTKQIYFNFLIWLDKIDKQLFPEFH